MAGLCPGHPVEAGTEPDDRNARVKPAHNLREGEAFGIMNF
jgi:hypothetical protein